MTDDKSENLKPLSDSARLAEQLVEFSKTDKPKTTGSLANGRLSILRGEVAKFAIMDGVSKPIYDEDGNMVDHREEPTTVVDVPLLDSDE